MGDDTLSLILMITLIGVLLVSLQYAASQLEVTVNFEQERLDIVGAAHLVHDCLTGDDQAVSSSLLNSIQETGQDIEEACDLPSLTVDAQITNLQTKTIWTLDFKEASNRVGHSLPITIREGEDIHIGRLHVQTET